MFNISNVSQNIGCDSLHQKLYASQLGLEGNPVDENAISLRTSPAP